MACLCTCHTPIASRSACPHCWPLVLFCGSRTWDDQRTADDLMARLYELLSGRFSVIQGGARGGDDVAWLAAKKLGVHCVTEKPDRATHGKRAGLVRNINMLERRPQYVVALWDGMSRGAFHVIQNAVERYRIPTLIVRSPDGPMSELRRNP